MLKLLVLVVAICVVVYLVVRVIGRRGVASARPSSPDDDPNFLRDLDQRRWEERHRRQRDGDGSQTDDTP